MSVDEILLKSRFQPLERILAYDVFNTGFNGWMTLMPNFTEYPDFDVPATLVCKDQWPPVMLSSATYRYPGTHGAMSGTYSLKLSTRPGHILPLGSVNGVVCTVVKIPCAVVYFELILRGDVAVVSVRAVAGDTDGAVLFSFLSGEIREITGHGVACRAALTHEVEGYRRKLECCAALQKQDLVRIGHIERTLELRLGLGKYICKQLTSVAHLHYRHSAGSVVGYLTLGCFEHRLRHH